MSNPDVQTNKIKLRQSNFELLRIVSMCMIIAMHYMTKGMRIPKLSVDHSLHNIFFWIIYAFCLSSVNAYVFISGYFATDSKWNIGKLIRLWAEVLVYSICVPLVMSAFGIFDLAGKDLSVKQQIFLPMSYEHYWFATAYIMLFIVSPILNAAIQKLDKKVFKMVLITLVAVFCGFKSINPYLIPWDKYGNDVMWFIVLYVTAGYIRLYGVPFIKTKDPKKIKTYGFAAYVIFSLATFMIAFAYSFIVMNTGKLEYSMDMTYCYNYITIYIASIGLFVAFANMDTKGRDLLNRIAACTFGVYLLHDNIALRELWQKVLGIECVAGKWWQFFHMLLCIVIVFVIGVLIDCIRNGIFKAFNKPVKKDR
ncbi:MAG: acyltransferase [Lachnospiraceae bacterium]|nr:acyltransferase [Lachnospiraceae bacterium]